MDETYLIFGHRGARYGLNVRVVREMIWLPELSPIDEMPAYISGIFNLRGRVIPVMDLGLRLGHPFLPYSTSDRVVVIEADAQTVGIIANELYAVVAINESAIAQVPGRHGATGHAQFVHAEAKLDDGLAMLLDADALLRSAPSAPAPLAPQSPAALPEESAIFRTRARSLAQSQVNAEAADLDSYAVIRLNGELFGLALDQVREFSHLRGIAPLPCCPPHILGNMNLRGDILTLVDVRPALRLDVGDATSEVVVMHIGELHLGLPASDIVDVVQRAAAEVAPVPIASAQAGRDFCTGVTTVEGRAVGILDMKKILASYELQLPQDAH